MKIKKVAIIGVGLMGGSLSLSLKEKFSHVSVWGYARSDHSCARLEKLGILDRVCDDLHEIVDDADLVVLALPIYAIIKHMKLIAPFLKKDAIVMDMGSTKELIEKSSRKYLPGCVHFVGCHPLCGAEKSGAQYSRYGLYQDAVCIITAAKNKPATDIVRKMWEALGAKVVFLSAKQHDKFLSAFSHLPHAVSFALTNLTAGRSKLILPSFKDLTRIANSPASVWGDIFLSNSLNLSRDISEYIKMLQKLNAGIKKRDKKAIERFIDQANIRYQQMQ